MSKAENKDFSRERAAINNLITSAKDECREKVTKHPTQSDSTRATAASGRAGARNSPDKSQERDLKGMRSGD